MKNKIIVIQKMSKTEVTNILLRYSKEIVEFPSGIAIDNKGNYIIWGYYNPGFHVFSPDFKLINSYGTDSFENDELFCIEGIAIDHHGNYIMCDKNHKIQIYSSEWKFIHSFGSYGSDEGQFDSPLGIAIDHQGNYVICDFMNHRIQIFSPEWKYNEDEPISLEIKFLYSFGAVDSGFEDSRSEGSEFVDSGFANFRSEGFGFADSRSDEGHFDHPSEIVINVDGNYVICDNDNHRIQIFSKFVEGKSTPTFLHSFKPFGYEERRFSTPISIAIDHQGNYVVCAYCCMCVYKIQIFSPEFKFLYSLESEEAVFSDPISISVDHQGNYVVADFANHSIQVFKGPGEVPKLLLLCLDKI